MRKLRRGGELKKNADVISGGPLISSKNISSLRHVRVRRSKPGFRMIESSEIGPNKRVFVILFTEIRRLGLVGYDFKESYEIS